MAGGKRDYYEVLGVARDASAADIGKAYRKIANDNHPDHKPDDKFALERFKAAAEAFEVLNDPATRAEYDSFGYESSGVRGRAQHGRNNPFSVFEDFMNLADPGFMGRWEDKWGAEADRIRQVAKGRRGRSFPGLDLVNGPDCVSVLVMSGDGLSGLMEADYRGRKMFMEHNGVKLEMGADVDLPSTIESVSRRLGVAGYRCLAPSEKLPLTFEKDGVASSVNPERTGNMRVELAFDAEERGPTKTLILLHDESEEERGKMMFPRGVLRLRPWRESGDIVLNADEARHLEAVFLEVLADVIPSVSRAYIFPHGGAHYSDILHPSPRQLEWAYGMPFRSESAREVPYESITFRKERAGLVEEVHCTDSSGEAKSRVFMDPYLVTRLFVMEDPKPTREVLGWIYRGEWGRIPEIVAPVERLPPIEPRLLLGYTPAASDLKRQGMKN